MQDGIIIAEFGENLQNNFEKCLNTSKFCKINFGFYRNSVFCLRKLCEILLTLVLQQVPTASVSNSISDWIPPTKRF